MTTNIAIADLAANVGERTVSRLLEACTLVAIDGDDLRLRGLR